VDLIAWLQDDIALIRDRLDRQVWSCVPEHQRADLADGGGASLTFLAWHLARHADTAVNAVVRQRAPMVDDWLGRLGLEALPAGAGLPEAEDEALTARLDPEATAAYLDAVLADTAAWLGAAGPAALAAPADAVPGLERAGVPAGTLPWLEAMWAGQDGAFHVRWEVIGHGFNHLGEMVSVRNRLGLSPF